MSIFSSWLSKIFVLIVIILTTEIRVLSAQIDEREELFADFSFKKKIIAGALAIGAAGVAARYMVKRKGDSSHKSFVRHSEESHMRSKKSPSVSLQEEAEKPVQLTFKFVNYSEDTTLVPLVLLPNGRLLAGESIPPKGTQEIMILEPVEPGVYRATISIIDKGLGSSTAELAAVDVTRDTDPPIRYSFLDHSPRNYGEQESVEYTLEIKNF